MQQQQCGLRPRIPTYLSRMYGEPEAQFRVVIQPLPVLRRCYVDNSNVWNGMLFLHSLLNNQDAHWYAAEFVDPINEDASALMYQCILQADDKYRRPKSPFTTNPEEYRASRILYARDEWPAGAWLHEPDILDWNYRDKQCYMRRTYEGCWAGFVRLSNRSPLVGINVARAALLFKVHGGIRQAGDEMLGFECNRQGDYGPLMNPNTVGAYRDIRYVRGQTEKLADQVISYEQIRSKF